ncbi:MAG: hypothetical protein GX661_06255 [Acholeplasmataceae bacterium]|nr:hypothetical protein [Acholeplasmataceae bacterium]
MKKFYVNEKFFSIGDQFDILDETMKPVYKVKEKLFTIGKQFYFADVSGNVLAFCKQRLFRFLPQYRLFMGERLVATVKKRFTVFVKKYDILSEDGDFTIEGDILAWNFNIKKDGNVICNVHKNYTLFKDKYEITVEDGFNEVMALSLVIILDAVHHDSKSQNRRY